MSDYVSDPLTDEEVESSEEHVEETTPVEESAPVEEPAPVEESAPVEEEPVEEPASVAAEEVVEEPVSTQEVVQNVQEILTTEPAVSSDSASLEERVKVLEERLEKLISLLKLDLATRHVARHPLLQL